MRIVSLDRLLIIINLLNLLKIRIVAKCYFCFLICLLKFAFPCLVDDGGCHEKRICLSKDFSIHMSGSKQHKLYDIILCVWYNMISY